eukprot:CAMPEP_0172622030 /NCGR_PEP_ID=MMETSP1068-20121228/117259_1 /TAXON_ID=35684 /ORGANISM="Pseudopedinella elastica, Strain CCMP716" /LENGTH=44 /DNA_ID= /DNA_START= /DNA_END= /DNA_ORIENTATION=
MASFILEATPRRLPKSLTCCVAMDASLPPSRTLGAALRPFATVG